MKLKGFLLGNLRNDNMAVYMYTVNLTQIIEKYFQDQNLYMHATGSHSQKLIYGSLKYTNIGMWHVLSGQDYKSFTHCL